jgi:hypothetical protein
MNCYSLMEMLARGPVHPARIVEAKAIAAFTLLRGYDAVTVTTGEDGKPQCSLTASGRKTFDKTRAEVERDRALVAAARARMPAKPQEHDLSPLPLWSDARHQAELF